MPYIGQKPHNKVVTASEISDGIISADKLASNAVTTAKINADAVTDAKIADDVVGTEHLTAGEVDTTALGADAVTAAKIADNAISEEHLDATIITGLTALTSAPADTDELLISDAGTLKRIDVSLVGGKNTPAFEAYTNSNQSANHATNVKIQGDVEVYDSDSDYDKDTNYRFTPTTAGKYFCYMHVSFNGAADREYYVGPNIRLNGTSVAGAQYTLDTNDGGDNAYSLYKVINCNGSSDYIEYYHYHHDYSASSSVNLLGINSSQLRTIIGAFRLIGA